MTHDFMLATERSRARGTLGDYGRFLAMITGESIVEGRRVLSARSVQEMQADQVRGASIPPGQYVEKARGGFNPFKSSSVLPLLADGRLTVLVSSQ